MVKEGGCLCGAVRYQVTGEPMMQLVCHCKNCQRQAGSAFSVLFVVADDQVSVTGQLKTYGDHGDSGGEVKRQFCPDCGAPVFSLLPSQPGITIVKAGSLDDTSWLDPKMHVWCDSAQPWVDIAPTAQRHGKNP